MDLPFVIPNSKSDLLNKSRDSFHVRQTFNADTIPKLLSGKKNIWFLNLQLPIVFFHYKITQLENYCMEIFGVSYSRTNNELYFLFVWIGNLTSHFRH